MRYAVYAAVAITLAGLLVRQIIQEMAADRARRRQALRDGFERCADFTDRDRAAVVQGAYPEIADPGPGLEAIWHRGGR